MLKIGVTGNIGSGKTTVCKIFELLDVDIYYADERAKMIFHSLDIKNKLKEIFGDAIFDEEGNLLNDQLASIVFNNKNSLEKLNSIIHPLVKADFKKWADNYKENPYVLKEAALIFESGSYKELDKVIVVASPVNLMIERVKNRDNVSAESVEKRLQNQIDQETKIKKADFVIYNDEKELLMPQVLKVHNMLISSE